MSRECGCFYCVKIYSAKDIIDWADGGKTALCPLCSVSAVLPDSSLDRPLTVEMLEGMQSAYFLSESSLSPGGRFHNLSLGRHMPRVSYDPLPASVLSRIGQGDRASGLSLDSQSMDVLLDPKEMVRRVLFRASWVPLGAAVAGLFLSFALSAFAGPDSQPLLKWAAWLVLASAGVVMAAHLPSYRRAFQAMKAIRNQAWGSPSLAPAMGLPLSWDLRVPKTTDALFRDARDWARATESKSLREIWEQWMDDPDHVRNENLRQFIRVAQAHAGPGGPYEPGDPL